MPTTDRANDVYVLLVEDDPEDFCRIEALLQAIERERYWIVWAANWERARHEMSERCFDVVLVDEMTNGGGGRDFISDMAPLHPHSPMILITGFDEPRTIGAVEVAGAADYLVKDGLSADQLERAIRYARRYAQKSAMLEDVIEHAAAGVIALDAHGCPLVWNRVALDALGLAGTESAIVSADAVADALVRIGAADGPPIEITRADGRSFEVSHSSMRHGRVVTVLHDVTRRVEAERRLRQTLENVDRASTAKSNFLATMSHELRTPLNGILGMARVLETTPLSDLQRDGLDVIRSSGCTLLEIVNDVLDLSKIEAGCMQLESCEIAIGELVDDVVRMLAPTAAEKGVEMAAFVDPRARPTLRGDPLRVRQVLTNLVGNAVKFTHAGSIVVMVDEVEGARGASMRFSIVDTGVGIPSAKLDTLFVRYQQAHASTAREFGGTGLGLALCKELVGLMGGTISCSSVLDHGSTFCFMLPIADGTSGQMTGRGLDGRPSGIRVLVASPSAGIVNVLGSYVRALQGTFTIANSVEGVRRISQSGRFDAAILDGMLGAFGVGDLRQRLRSAALAPLRIFVLEGARGQGRELGFDEDEILSRPFVRQSFDRLLGHLKPPAGDLAIVPTVATADCSSRRLRILMAEDNPANQRVATALLNTAGFRLEIVDNGQAAIDRAAAEPFDVILMDVQMPVMDGYVASRLLRERDGLENVPIIGLTAGAMEEDRGKCLAAGMTAYLSKPIDWDKLLALLERIECECYGGGAKVAAA